MTGTSGDGAGRTQILPYGPTAVLVDGLDDPAGWALAAADVEGVVEAVPAERSVLIRTDRSSLAAVVERLAEVRPAPIDESVDEVVVPVRFDGPDLVGVAAEIDLTAEQLVARFCETTYSVAFCGFSPGFAYLRGLDRLLHLPRRATPRTRVEPGSVAIAAHYAAIYPTASPGGWHLLGTTEVAVWDVDRRPPALLGPGTRVRFRPS